MRVAHLALVALYVVPSYLAADDATGGVAEVGSGGLTGDLNVTTNVSGGEGTSAAGLLPASDTTLLGVATSSLPPVSLFGSAMSQPLVGIFVFVLVLVLGATHALVRSWRRIGLALAADGTAADGTAADAAAKSGAAEGGAAVSGTAQLAELDWARLRLRGAAIVWCVLLVGCGAGLYLLFGSFAFCFIFGLGGLLVVSLIAMHETWRRSSYTLVEIKLERPRVRFVLCGPDKPDGEGGNEILNAAALLAELKAKRQQQQAAAVFTLEEFLALGAVLQSRHDFLLLDGEYFQVVLHGAIEVDDLKPAAAPAAAAASCHQRLAGGERAVARRCHMSVAQLRLFLSCFWLAALVASIGYLLTTVPDPPFAGWACSYGLAMPILVSVGVLSCASRRALQELMPLASPSVG